MISVCLACFNGQKYIKNQIESILSQLQKDDEIIVSDGGSTDDTIKIISEIKDKRIKLVKLDSINDREPNEPVFRIMNRISKNFESALKHVKGEFIFLADQDDIWLPDKIKRMLPYFEHYCCIVHDCYVTDSNLKVLSDTFFNYIKPNTSFLGTLYRSSFMGCCMAFKKDVLELSLPFPAYPIEHDTWIGINALSFGKVLCLNDSLIFYRRHTDNVSSCAEGSKNSIYIKLKRRMFILRAIISRLFL